VKRRATTLPPRARGGKKRRGLFVVLEGLDGAGTTTQAAALERALRARGQRVQVTAEPSPGPIGVLLRQALTGRLTGLGQPIDQVTLALLFSADRADHTHQEILPALSAGVTVICDRYVLSSLAYQGLDLPLEEVAAINAHAPAPDLTLFLDVPPKVAEARRQASRGHAERFERLDLQKRIDRNYRRALAHGLHGGALAMIDGTLPPEQVTTALLQALDAL
jgi:dTMP kinase